MYTYAPTPSYIRETKQHPKELLEFQNFIRETGVKSYLEIGGKYGGSLWAVAQAMGSGKVVAVDLHGEMALQQCIKQLKKQYGFDAQLFIGDSTAEHIVKAVHSLAPFDLVLIDANHLEPYVRKDFAHYGPLAKYCCFHDVGWIPHPGYAPIEVPKVWKELKETFKDQADFREIKHDNGHNGIGILTWRPI
jgi:cephalosporin hydroxylase